MRLKVDQWAGSFEGQQRAKLEMAIAPELDALDRALAKAERTARGVLDDLGAGGTWQGRHDRDVAARRKIHGRRPAGDQAPRAKEQGYALRLRRLAGLRHRAGPRRPGP